uniref:Uncharacterized protein n=1 Tax=Rhizophora mucronata TaxID=61149 RepID=A0A2P2PC49_RHIMU
MLMTFSLTLIVGVTCGRMPFFMS